MIRVLMMPTLDQFDSYESGIKRVIEAYRKYSDPKAVEFVDCPVEEEDKYDVLVVHAGSSDKFPIHRPVIAVLHGLYWVADYAASTAEWRANAYVIESIRRAATITVPSNWVAETIRRDVRVNPIILPHGINWQEWQHDKPPEDYILWNKNRVGDVCTAEPLGALADMRPNVRFTTTFPPEGGRPNIAPMGLLPHDAMKDLVQRSAVYLSTTKETFGIGVLEAMASGVPVLGFAFGGNLDIVEHGVTGYLARPNDVVDLANGLDYCLRYRDVLSANSKIAIKKWGWDRPMRIFENALRLTVDQWADMQRPLKIDPKTYAADK